MHKMSSATKVSDQLPNYMKPTCSSDVRKEKFKVRNHSPTTSDRIRNPRNLSNLNCSKPSTSSPDGSGLKHAKFLKRKPSLIQVRPWMKKSFGVALCPKLYVNRATCSSTLKDSKFPKALELNQGGAKAEGTSIMKVCPYTYCSLNGHRHEPLPPLKCFLSSRRNLLKTQKSMKVKGVSPFTKKGLGKDEKEVDTGQAVLSRAPSALEILMEEVATDFFVEIYAKPHKQNVKSFNCDEGSHQEKDDTKNPEVLKNLEFTGDDRVGAKCEEDDRRNLMDEIHEYSSVTSFEEDLDQNSDLSIEEMDVMMSVQKYANCDQQDEDEEGNSTSLVRKNDAELSSECQVMDGLVKESEGFAGSAIEVPFGASEMNLEEDVDTFPGNKTDCSESTDDGFGPLFRHPFENDDPGNGLSLNAKIAAVACKIPEPDVEPSYEAYEEVAERDHATASEGINSERNDVYSDDEKESSAINSGSCDDNVQDQSTDFLISQPLEAEILKENHLADPPFSKENSSGVSFLGHLEASKETEEGSATKHDLGEQAGEGEASEAVNLEANHVGIKEEDDRNEEVEDASSLSDTNLSGSNKGSTEKENGATESDHIQTEMEIKVYQHDDTTKEANILLKIHHSLNDLSDEVDKEDNLEKSQKKHQEELDETVEEQDWCEIDHVVQIKDDLEICLTGSTEGPEEDRIIITAAALSNQAPAEASGRQKAKICMVRKQRADEEDQMKEFNPRAPNFLPIEPDPEAEKVDLRHQEMDERKNAEEWMIDHALQQAVTKLAPDRKMKVALLVEAFETVMPTPMCEKAEQHTSQGFDHARPMQACS
ncbi:calmodulin binding protein PICBP [Cocos nucifera]|uniref:Calmodulin binding protein PICBP n=1 Tax=Cocos nucifera TaxID=13894 RepID=A0A8K0IXU1_COCNU|nr:calmodulin binding protein PICBP [Cocos nucifera]